MNKRATTKKDQIPFPYRCSACGRITKANAAIKSPAAKFRTREPTPDALIKARCPHCVEWSYIGSDDEIWYCACQICQCPETADLSAAS